MSCHRVLLPRQGGFAMIMALFFAVVATGLILSGSLLLTATERRTEIAFRMNAQARQFARAGLIDALAWFRRQTTQPVATFNPLRDLSSSPPVIDTEDPTIGIVREFEINGALWGRYEVRRTDVRDVSADRLMTGTGVIWHLKSWGLVYRRVNSSVAYNAAPNQVLGRQQLEIEIRRMTLAPPGAAALCTRVGSTTVIGDKGSLVGGNTGVGLYYMTGTGTPSLQSGSTVSGTPTPTASSSIYDASPNAVFGVSEAEVRSLADDRITNNTQFPNPVPRNQVLFADCDVTFNATRPLRGSGILYIKGNVTIASSSNSFFTGFIYITGNLTMGAPANINGTVIVGGSVSVAGVGDKAEISYDPTALNALRTEVGQYRLFGAVRNMREEGH